MWHRVEFEIGQGADNPAPGNLEHAQALLWTRDPSRPISVVSYICR